ncbi:Transcriptional regulatory protein ZraR [bacterium HR11]|nr:Transcriptional regulatory protein ZraR [bacterium HR11]
MSAVSLGPVPQWIGGVFTERGVTWLVLPAEKRLEQTIAQHFRSYPLERWPLYPACGRETIAGGHLIAARWPGLRVAFMWIPPDVDVPPTCWTPLLAWLVRWQEDLQTPRGVPSGETLSVLLELAQAILKMEDFQQVLFSITQKATELLQAERASLFLVNKEENAMDTFLSVRRDARGQVILDTWTHISVPRGRGIVWRSVLDGKLLIVDDVRSHPDFYAEADAQTGYQTRSLLCIPLVVREDERADRPIGALELINKLEGTFDAHDRETATLFAAMAAPMVRLAQAYQELEESRRQLEMMNQFLQAQVQASDAELQKLRIQLEWQKKDPTYRARYHRLIGHSPAMQRIYETIELIKDTDLPVLITGESGTGKELVARSIHEASRRAGQRFVAINCAAIPETLMERELFGAERGAFTGAYQTTQGLIEAADGGTLFLDEIGEMPLALQAKLLRAIETGEVRRLGATQSVRVDVRVLAATNRKLEQYVQEGRFREDLYYRLNVFRIDLPPLRDRKEDIPLLVDYFLRQVMEALHLPEVYVDPQVIQIFMAYAWPGNVRQLENEVRRMATLGHGRLTVDLVSPDILRGIEQAPWIRSPAVGDVSAAFSDQDLNLERLEAWAIREALRRVRGNKARAARLLGISRRTLYDKMARYGIVPSESAELP